MISSSSPSATYRTCNNLWSTCRRIASLRQNGSDKVDSTRFVFVEDDGSAVLIGNTDGSWSGNSYGGNDLAAVKLDVNGGELWRWQVTTLVRRVLFAAVRL